MLALIAGQGRLPALVYERLQAEGQAPLVAELDGFKAGTPVSADITFRLETLGGFFDDLAARGVTQVAFAGRIRRPMLDPERVDRRTKQMFATISSALRDGDDGALRTILNLFADAGFEIVALPQIMPDLLPPPGAAAKIKPDRDDDEEARIGMRVIAAMGAADVGQACVVAMGTVIAVEAAPGTDWMLETLTKRPDDLPPGGLLIKAAKPGQDRRADLPTIGPGTIRAAAAAGLTGVVIEAGSVLVIDPEEAVAEADRLGLFLWTRLS